MTGMAKADALREVAKVAKKIAAADRRRAALVAERDDLMRHAKSAGATWEELQVSAGMSSPTAVARSLKRAQ